MSPDGGGAPGGALGEAVATTFGGFDALKAALIEGGVKRFGSGWSWLVWDGTALAVYSTANQDSPLAAGRHAPARDRRLGARLLPEVPEQAARLPRGLVERRQLARGRAEVRRGDLLVGRPCTRPCRRTGRRGLTHPGGCYDSGIRHGPRCVETERWSWRLKHLRGYVRSRSGARARRRARRTPICSFASRSATARPSSCSTAGTSARSSGSQCAACATASARRTRCRRRSPRSGAPRGATGRSAARRRPGCTPSRGTRSSTGCAPAPNRRARCRRWSRPSRALPTGRRRRSSPGASTARSRSCRRRSARCSSSRTGARCPRARLRTTSNIPLGTVKTRTRSALARLADLLEGELA